MFSTQPNERRKRDNARDVIAEMTEMLAEVADEAMTPYLGNGEPNA